MADWEKLNDEFDAALDSMTPEDWNRLATKHAKKMKNSQTEKRTKRTDWVFWLQIERRDWFRKVWKSRGSNNLNIHFYGYHISIGLPWLKDVIEYHEREGSNEIERTNLMNREGVKTHGRFRFIKKRKQ